jgi:MFS family permease
LAALLLVWRFVAPGGRPAHLPEAGHPLDFRPVFANRPAFAYVLGYAAHVWELFGTRTWIVAFVAFAYGLQPADGDPLLAPTQVATIVLLLGLPATILGNEAAVRFGRRRTVAAIMLASALLSCGLGFLGGLPAWAIVAVLVVHHMVVMGDSSALTAGAVANARPGRRGATMAMHALFGFGTGVLSPLAFGAVLDIAGGAEQTLAWGLAFAVLALGPLALGLPVLARMGRTPARAGGDRAP